MILKFDVGFSTKVCNGLIEIDRINWAKVDAIHPNVSVRPIMMPYFDQWDISSFELVRSTKASILFFE